MVPHFACAHTLQAFLKGGDPKQAVGWCVQLHQWDLALELAAQHRWGAAQPHAASQAGTAQGAATPRPTLCPDGHCRGCHIR